MSLNDIPVRVVGPGSQPLSSGDEKLGYIDMPRDMARYAAPAVPEPEAVRGLTGAREAMDWLREALARFETGSEPRLANLDALDADNRELVNQILGEGEVSISYDGEVRVRAQEAVLAGVWRTFYLDDEDNVLHDVLEVGDVPHVLRRTGGEARPVDVSPAEPGVEVPNALPLLVELEARHADYRKGGGPHTINLSLLPLSDEELEFLDARLGRGPADVLSRAYGKCQVISTSTDNVWWVRYYNSIGTPILNSLEITDIPEIVCAAPEDLRDSAERLEQIVAPYWSEVA